MANRLRVTEASQQRTVSVGVEVSSAPQKGAGSIVWLFPSYAHFRFTHSFQVTKRQELER